MALLVGLLSSPSLAEQSKKLTERIILAPEAEGYIVSQPGDKRPRSESDRKEVSGSELRETNGDGYEEKLKRLKGLLDKGLITREVFDQHQKKLLDENL